MGEIKFYRKSDDYGCFSNLFERKVVVDHVVYRTAEHAYQVAALKNEQLRDWVASAPTGRHCALVMHRAMIPVWDFVPGWTAVKLNKRWQRPSSMQLERMRKVLTAKFTQHADLAEILINTGDKTLVEFTRGTDQISMIWGCGKHCEENDRWDAENPKHGGNWLGRLLMELRSKLLANQIERQNNEL